MVAASVLPGLHLPVQLIVAIVARVADAHRIQFSEELQLDQLSLFFDRFRECLEILNYMCTQEFVRCRCSLG